MLVACFILWKDSSITLYLFMSLSILDLINPFKNILALNILIHYFSSANLSVCAEIIASLISLSLISRFCWLVCFLLITSQKDWILVVLYNCFTCVDFSTESSISLHLLLNFILDSCSVFRVLSLVESLISWTSLSKYLFFNTSKSCFTQSFMFKYMSFL